MESMKETVLVTGAAHRLGKEFALALAREGWNVAVHYGSSAAFAQKTVSELESLGVKAVAFGADLSKSSAPQKLVGEVLSWSSRLDAIVVSASPWVEGPLDSVTESDWDLVMNAGPRASFFLAQAARAELSKARGAILLISDVAAVRPWPNHIPHAVAKATIDALVRNLACALAPEIRVNGLAPGIVLPPPGLSEAECLRLIARTPLKRQVAVEDVTAMALAILKNRSMTGHVVAVDGGRILV